MGSNFGKIGPSVAELWASASAAYGGSRFISFDSGFLGVLLKALTTYSTIDTCNIPCYHRTSIRSCYRGNVTEIT